MQQFPTWRKQMKTFSNMTSRTIYPIFSNESIRIKSIKCPKFIVRLYIILSWIVLLGTILPSAEVPVVPSPPPWVPEAHSRTCRSQHTCSMKLINFQLYFHYVISTWTCFYNKTNIGMWLFKKIYVFAQWSCPHVTGVTGLCCIPAETGINSQAL